MKVSGPPLPFESRPVGANVAEAGEEPVFCFGAEDIEAYCQALGFSPWGVEYESAWVMGK